MKKILLNYTQPVTKVFRVQTEYLICTSGEGTGDRNNYDEDNSWTDE